MTRHVSSLLCVLSLAVVVCACVRLNSIRTVIVHEVPGELTLHQCISDLECSEGSYCHAPSRGPAHSRCQTCRRRTRRCHREGMCCPGNRCSNSVCVPDDNTMASERVAPEHPDVTAWRKRDRTDTRTVSGKGQVGDPCLGTSECSDGLCCARHFWTRICKPVLWEGQVCSRHGRKRQRGLELFQRCPCGRGLACRTRDHVPPPSSTLLAAANSKFAAHPSFAPQTRLHVCHRK
ncbi:dickkopf-related protein 2-like [Dunckerocampus dactyliophorus]|uniref:dickkopf-related protein 2-like n=1 Tax=Dunckerocampus dactyliophorus TaxID=161453 RepID=UPI0024065336|nr:dickkopf-related protein 2-like [Dunckerocampus dactyliophorus]